jgi:hypothetical protein
MWHHNIFIIVFKRSLSSLTIQMWSTGCMFFHIVADESSHNSN